MTANRIDTEGAYRGLIEEGVVSETKRGFPQYVVRLKATKKWIESSTEMGHYGLAEPGWIDWTEFDEGIMGFLVLANDEKRLLNFEQIMVALDWDGQSFAELAAMDTTGREVLFRVEENEYNGEMRLQVNWIDDKDAPVTRELKALDESKLKDLDAKYAGMMPEKTGGKKAAAAKPKAATKKDEKPAGKGGSKDGKPASGKPGKTTPKAVKPKAGPPASKPPAKTETEEPPFETDGFDFGEVPDGAEDAQMHIWTVLTKHFDDENAVGEAWVEACREVGGDREEAAFTKDDWMAVGARVAGEMTADKS